MGIETTPSYHTDPKPRNQPSLMTMKDLPPQTMTRGGNTNKDNQIEEMVRRVGFEPTNS